MLVNDSINKSIAITALEQVFDPEIGLNVIDLGLIYDIIFDDECEELTVIMTLTTSLCPMGQSIQNNVKSTLKQYFNSFDIIVNLVFDPAWSPDLISEKGRDFLNT